MILNKKQAVGAIARLEGSKGEKRINWANDTQIIAGNWGGVCAGASDILTWCRIF